MSALEDFVYSQEDLFASSFLFMHDMKEKGVLSDVTIRIGGRFFSAHRIILAAGIPYFRDIFESSTEENEKKEVTVTELDPVAFESLINFAYTNKIKITTDNVRSLLTASQFLQMTKVRDACCDFLSKMLDLDNVMEIRNLADSLNCSKLVEISDCFIRKNFEDFCQTKEFLDVSYPFLSELIRRDDLHAADEEKVFEAVMRWVEVDPDERSSFLPDLLTGVRMTLLSFQFLIKKASREKLILESFPCRDLLDEVKYYHLLPEERSTCTFTTTPRIYEAHSDPHPSESHTPVGQPLPLPSCDQPVSNFSQPLYASQTSTSFSQLPSASQTSTPFSQLFSASQTSTSSSQPFFASLTPSSSQPFFASLTPSSSQTHFRSDRTSPSKGKISPSV